jgi:hypothetical protein
VAARRQFQPQLGGHHAAAAIRRVTGDPDLHPLSIGHFQRENTKTQRTAVG